MSETKTKPPGRFKSAVLKWLGAPISLADGDFWGAWNGGGKALTVDAALQLSTVWACVRLISETISTLPLGFYEKLPDGSRRSASEHPLYELLHNQPNADMTAVQFWEAVIASMLLWGNAYIEKAKIGKRVVALNFLLPQRMTKRRLSDGSMEYKYRDLDGQLRLLGEDELINIPAFSLDGVNGLTPMAYGAKVFSSATATEDASAKVFATGMRAAGVLKMGATVTDKDQREALRVRLNQFTAGGPNAGSVLVLENGADFQQLSINPNDSEMIASRQHGVEEICRWFMTPPSMVGHGTAVSNWGTGREQIMLGFLTFTLRPWLSRVEQAIRKSLIAPVDRNKYFAEFNIEGLLRADSAARAAFYSIMSQNGIYTRNEIRKFENLPRVDGGDELTVQSNLIPLSMLGKITSTATAAKNAVIDWLGLKQDGETKHEA
jgi:HK97 family phage portal protein